MSHLQLVLLLLEMLLRLKKGIAEGESAEGDALQSLLILVKVGAGIWPTFCHNPIFRQ